MKKASLSIAVVILSCGFALGQYQVLYSFGTNGGSLDGWAPNGALVADSAGNLYGTTFFGGTTVDAACTEGCGTVFELSPPAVPGGPWTEKILLSFVDGEDGQGPESGLIFDSHGNLYGTTWGSGDGTCVAPDCGTVFELSPSGGGGWTETILYAFANLADGAVVSGPVVFDAAGNLYGTTDGGGTKNEGTVFELSPPSIPGESWTKTTLYNFCQVGSHQCLDGENPLGGVTFDTHGNLFGTTPSGGKLIGLVYELSPGAGGVWSGTVLHNFTVAEGAWPYAGVTLDSAGDLYGTLFSGGSGGPNCIREHMTSYCGAAFRMTPGADGKWNETSFLFDGADGGNPTANLVIAGASIYGTTVGGGKGWGTLFRVTGKNDVVIHEFCTKDRGGQCEDGSDPGDIVIIGGALYGVTQYGGASDQGVVFEVTP